MVVLDITFYNAKHTFQAPSSSLNDVQDVIAKKFGVPPEYQQITSTHVIPLWDTVPVDASKEYIVCDGKLFVQQEQKQTSAYAQNLSHIHVRYSNNPITVHVHTLTGKKIAFLVNKTSLVLDLMFRVQQKEGIPRDLQRLVFSGQSLNEDCTLESCGIEDGATLILVLRLRGGMMHETSGKDGAFGVPTICCNFWVNNKKKQIHVPVGALKHEVLKIVAKNLTHEEMVLAMLQ